jgi:hypothetical protein
MRKPVDYSDNIRNFPEVRIEDVLHLSKSRSDSVRAVKMFNDGISIDTELYLDDPTLIKLKLTAFIGDQLPISALVRLIKVRPNFGGLSGWSAVMLCPYLPKTAGLCEKPVRKLFLRPLDTPPQWGCRHCLKLKYFRLNPNQRLMLQQENELKAFWESSPPDQRWLSKEEVDIKNEYLLRVSKQSDQLARDQRKERFMQELSRINNRIAQRSSMDNSVK